MSLISVWEADGMNGSGASVWHSEGGPSERVKSPFERRSEQSEQEGDNLQTNITEP
ncbi:MAG: hypothetical protein U5K72_19790 [Balneolaceae bacterium]|nr:hypothetical protein [Balneolaceae bacterium]